MMCQFECFHPEFGTGGDFVPIGERCRNPLHSSPLGKAPGPHAEGSFSKMLNARCLEPEGDTVLRLHPRNDTTGCRKVLVVDFTFFFVPLPFPSIAFRGSCANGLWSGAVRGGCLFT